MSYATKLRVYPEAEFGGITRFDGPLLYYSRVNALIDCDSIVLDYGCGRGAHLSKNVRFYKELCSFRSKAKKVIGVDVEASGGVNPTLDEFRPLENGSIPLDSSSVDLCHSDWVVEHLEDVHEVFEEICRVLKPGGYFCFRTPNRFHYSSFGAAIVPFSWHHRIRRFLKHFHEQEDVFPTYYRCNTRWAAIRRLREHGFKPLVQYHRGLSHLNGLGYWPGLLGRWIEAASPLFLCHEIHAFGKKTSRRCGFEKPLLGGSISFSRC